MTLNAAQQAVVDSKAALRVVLAGPGSGKTRTLVESVMAVTKANIKGGPNVIRIAVMTFTNAGAGEFRERLNPAHSLSGLQPYQSQTIEGMLGVKLAYCGTLHGYCFRLIQRFGNFLGYIPGKVAILPDKERIPRLLASRDKLGKKISEKALVEKSGGQQFDIELVWREYEFLLKRNNLVDFDGILLQGLALLQMTPVRHQVQLDYLFVDEYQDSALIDQKIYEAIPALNRMYVGDSDQSIFAFRGANPMGFVHLAKSVFDNSLTDAEGFKLELNYRSDTLICLAANQLIGHNRERVEKCIQPVSPLQGCIEVYSLEDAGQELAYLGATISGRNLGSKKLSESESIAVLYRMKREVKQCRDYLKAMGLAVQEPKYEQRPADWERALLLLGLCLTPSNQILAERYLKIDYSAAEVNEWILVAQSTGTDLSARVWNKIGGTVYHLPGDDVRRFDPTMLAKAGVSEGTVRMIKERAELLAPDADLSDLLHDLHSPEPKNEEPEKASNEAGIYVGTMHSAKGREWDVVFLPAFEQGIIPSSRNCGVCRPCKIRLEVGSAEVGPCENVEEERRLAFVAVTRARHELYISHCAHRRGPWGPVGTGQPSQFIEEMGL